MEESRRVRSRLIVGAIMVFLTISVAPAQLASAATTVTAPFQNASSRTARLDDPTGIGKATATATADAPTGRLYAFTAASGGAAVGAYAPPYNPVTYITPVAGVAAARASARSSITQDIAITSAGTYAVTANLDQVVTNSAIAIKPICWGLPYVHCYFPTDLYVSQTFYYYQAVMYLTCYWGTYEVSSKTYLGNPYDTPDGKMSISGSIHCGAPTHITVIVVIESFSEAQGNSRSSAEISGRLASLTLTP